MRKEYSVGFRFFASKFMKATLLFFATLLILFSACDTTNSSSVFNAVEQAKKDDATLVQYFKDRGLTDSVTKTSSGLYYRVTKKCPDSVAISTGNLVFVDYEGRLLNDTLFGTSFKDAVRFSFTPGEGATIKAWEEGILLFRKGEEGYLYTPSGLAYGNSTSGKIPANSCLRFFIAVRNVEK